MKGASRGSFVLLPSLRSEATESCPSVFRVVLYKLRDELTASREELVSVSKRHIELKRRVTKLSNERMRLFKVMADDYTWLRGRLEKQVGSFDTDVQAGFQGPTATRLSCSGRPDPGRPHPGAAVVALTAPVLTLC